MNLWEELQEVYKEQRQRGTSVSRFALRLSASLVAGCMIAGGERLSEAGETFADWCQTKF